MELTWTHPWGCATKLTEVKPAGMTAELIQNLLPGNGEIPLNFPMESQLRWLALTCILPWEALLCLPLESLMGHFRISLQRLLQMRCWKSMEVSSTGCPTCQTGITGASMLECARETGRNIPKPAVSLQRPLLTKCNIVPAGKRQMFQYHKKALKDGFGTEKQ